MYAHVHNTIVHSDNHSGEDNEHNLPCICQLKKIRNPNVEIITIPGNLDTKDWGIKAAHYMVDELKERGAIGDEIQY